MTVSTGQIRGLMGTTRPMYRILRLMAAQARLVLDCGIARGKAASTGKHDFRRLQALAMGGAIAVTVGTAPGAGNSIGQSRETMGCAIDGSYCRVVMTSQTGAVSGVNRSLRLLPRRTLGLRLALANTHNSDSQQAGENHCRSQQAAASEQSI